MKISIVTPTCDRPGFLPGCIASVLAQDYQDWEHVIYDVGASKIRDLVPDDPRIRYVEGGDAQGLTADVQAAVELATGEIVHPVADDDRLPAGALARVAQIFAEWPGEWLYGQTDIVDEDGSLKQRIGWPFSLDTLRHVGYTLGGGVYWRRSLTDRLGGFDPAYRYAPDYELFLRFADDQEPLFVPEVLQIYTDHAGSHSALNSAEQRAECERIRRPRP